MQFNRRAVHDSLAAVGVTNTPTTFDDLVCVPLWRRYHFSPWFSVGDFPFPLNLYWYVSKRIEMAVNESVKCY